MVPRPDDISHDLQTQWQDHFHMRDQTRKVLQYSILFFLGVIGLEIKGVGSLVLQHQHNNMFTLKSEHFPSTSQCANEVAAIIF
jgi:hypothetical protein